jgi:hypothetical protein
LRIVVVTGQISILVDEVSNSMKDRLIENFKESFSFLCDFVDASADSFNIAIDK